MHSFGKDYFTYYRGAFSTGLYEPTLSFDENYVTYFLVRLLLKTGNFLFTCCSFYSRDQSFSKIFGKTNISCPPDARASVSSGLFCIFI